MTSGTQRLKILSVLGTRPEAIKMAPVLRALSARPDRFTSRVCVTAQHRQMLDQSLHLFGIRPDHDLDLMRPNQSPTQVVSSVLAKLEPILVQEAPDWLLVQGDTSTVMGAAIAGFQHRIHIGHVEAGLRTFDRLQPFPEEINRRVVSLVADLHFAPTERARANLLAEGISGNCVHVTGNTVVDALRWIAQGAPLEPASSVPLILVTAHRRESFGQPIRDVCRALASIANRFPNVRILYPVHPNPNVRGPVHELLGCIRNVTLAEPLDYPSLVHTMIRSHLILTDSGGIQEEAAALGKPVLVLRNVTERPEGVESGIAEVVGTDSARIVSRVAELFDDREQYMRMAQSPNPYGDGHAAERICELLTQFHQ